MPAEQNNNLQPMSGRCFTSRTPLFLGMVIFAVVACLAPCAPARADQPPGAYLDSSGAGAPGSYTNTDNQQAPQQQDQGQWQPQNNQQNNQQMSSWQQPAGQNPNQNSGQNFSQNQGQQSFSANGPQPGTFQGNATIGVTGTPGVPSAAGQYPVQNMAPPQQQYQQTMQQPMQQQAQQQYQQPQQPAQTASGSGGQSQYPTLDELKDKLDQTSIQTGNQQAQVTQNAGGGGGAGGMASSLIRTIGNIAAPMAYGRTGMGMGMPGYGGMGMGMPMGMPMGMGGMSGLPMGMGGMGMGGMGMGYNPFMSPSQQMMNSIINQGARLFSH